MAAGKSVWKTSESTKKHAVIGRRSMAEHEEQPSDTRENMRTKRT